MREFILRSLESLSSVGYVVVVLGCTLVGFNEGLYGSSFLGLIAGFMLGVVAASILFGLALLALGIYRNTNELLLTQKYGAEKADEMLRVAKATTGFMGLSGNAILSVATRGYLIVFFAYMFLPLIFMFVAAFNTPGIPTAVPFEGFTLSWFGDLFANGPLWSAVLNSIIIGFGVIAVSLSLGLAGALLLTRLHTKARTLIYGVLVSPLLTPGIILGISTLVFWNNLGIGGGLFLATLAQSTFISAYCMLLFMARLQRFDSALEEAALDLGASHQKVFWRITLPFLRPTIATGAVLAFLQSFENFNTTVFAIGTDTTMTIKLASMARLSLTPEVNALAVIFIVMTIAIAVLYELKRRADKVKEEMRREVAKRLDRQIAASVGEPSGLGLQPQAAE